MANCQGGVLFSSKAFFQGTGMSVTKEGKRHLRATLHTDFFRRAYVHEKDASWVQEVECLSQIAVTQSHAAYAAFTHGLTSKQMDIHSTYHS